MGRVEEAMKRAAQEREPAAAGIAAVPGAADATDARFPVEGAASPLLASAVLDPTAATVQAEAPAVPDAARPASLLETTDRRLSGKLVAGVGMPIGSREQYRRLAATLHRSQMASGLKVVMVASAVAGEGKSLTAANLALTLSESYKRSVLLIDGDLRKPSLHTIFQIDGTPGLSDSLLSTNGARMPLHRMSDNLTVLTAGRPTSDPIEALISVRMQQLIQEARETFEWVIIDTPPIGLMSDANLLAATADGVVLVVKASATPYQLVQRAVEALGRDRILGMVLNRATQAPQGGKYYSNYYGKYYRGYYGSPEAAGRKK